MSETKTAPQAFMPRSFLYLTAALSGAAIMVIEILGANMLAPYVGTSHFVWSAQITVTLFALALGYYAGGLAADRTRDMSVLYGGIAVAATYLVVPALFRGPIAAVCLNFNLALSALLISFLLFFIPLTLLAAVGPFLVRFVTDTMDGVGGKVGLLIAIGTVGSLAGTLGISYLMVPFLSHTVSIYIVSTLLIIPAFAYFLIFEKRRRKALIAVALGAGILLFAILFLGPEAPKYRLAREIYRAETHYGLVQVLESKDLRWRVLLTDYLVQNQYSLPYKASMTEPAYVLHALGARYAGRIERALCIGLGAGILPSQLAREGVRTDVVEINPAIPDIAMRFFNFDPRQISLTIDDARHFLRVNKNHYDVIYLDAFLNDGALFHLLTLEAFESMRASLTPEGALVINTLGDVSAQGDFFTGSAFKTLLGVFPHVRLHANPDGSGGIYFAASSRPLNAAAPLPGTGFIHSLCRQSVASILGHTVVPNAETGLVLTDDFNPSPFFDAARRESLRKHFYRQLAGL